jgi:riboflavin synthase
MMVQIKSLENPWQTLQLGSSIAIDGCCLTLLKRRASPVNSQAIEFEFELGHETWNTTKFRDARIGGTVNVEPALLVGDPIDGHFVTGHIDAIGRVAKIHQDKQGIELEIEVDRRIASQLVHKGSVAVDGVSLTVNNLSANTFSVSLLPYTAEKSTLGSLRLGTLVNIELDLLGKYVARSARAWL